MTDTKADLEKYDFAKGRGKESLLRVTLRNQVHQIGIADRRARIVLSITTLLISLILVALLTSDLLIFQEQLLARNLSNPLVVLMVWCLISSLASIVSLNPIQSKESSGYADSQGLSLLFAKNLSSYSLDEYRERMHELLSSNEGIYNAMITDIYNYGRLINSKFRLLRVAYWSLIAGLISSVLVFFII